MRKLSFIAFLFLSLSAFAARPQKRAVIVDTICNANIESMLQSVEKYCYQFQACPDSLFQWAYLGMEEQKNIKKTTRESRDAIRLRYKDRLYDPEHKIGDVAIDVYVLGVRWWKDQHLITHYTLTNTSITAITSQLHAAYSGGVLEGGEIIFTMEPISETQTRVHYEFCLTFGKFLSSFISDKTWQNAIEWRFKIIIANLIEYAETGTVLPKSRTSAPDTLIPQPCE